MTRPCSGSIWRAADMARIDAHLHVWDLGVRRQPWLEHAEMAGIRRSFDADIDLAPELARAEVDTGILVQVLNRGDETDELLALARQRPWLAGVVGWVDLTGSDVGARLERAASLGPLVGVRHQLQSEPDPGGWLGRPTVSRGLGILAALGVPFELMVRPAQFETALHLVRRHPSLRFIVDHAGKPPIHSGELEPWAATVRRLAREPNVVCKLSGLVTVADRQRWTIGDLKPYADVVLEAFGPRRVMIGSDWPVCLLAATYPDVVDAADLLTAQLSPDESECVWSGTAAAVYGIRPLTAAYL
jgi:L-fuconolactonase